MSMWLQLCQGYNIPVNEDKYEEIKNESDLLLSVAALLDYTVNMTSGSNKNTILRMHLRKETPYHNVIIKFILNPEIDKLIVHVCTRQQEKAYVDIARAFRCAIEKLQ